MNSVYKYFGNKNHLCAFVENGEVYLNSLSYFISCEDASRRDESEDTYVYRPQAGLQINNLTTGQSFILPVQLNSKIQGADDIYLFCTSTELSESLFKKFGAYGCVEIFDVEAFKNRLNLKIKEFLQQENYGSDQLLDGPVVYYDASNEPETRHACPDQIVMAKPERFGEEREYRFAFSKIANTFQVNQVDYTLSSKMPISTTKHGSVLLQLGSLSDICRTVSFK